MNSLWPLLITLIYVAIAMMIGLRARGGQAEPCQYEQLGRVGGCRA